MDDEATYLCNGRLGQEQSNQTLRLLALYRLRFFCYNLIDEGREL